jgi:ABC-type amino acid transport substrate-binding protein
MSLKTYIFSALLCTAAAFFLFFNKERSTNDEASEIITIGTSPDYPPFAFIDEQTNKIVGFDVDVASEVATRMGKAPVVKRMPFKSLIFGLLAEDIDIIAAGISPTKRREKAIGFSTPYLEGDPLVALYNKNITINSFDDLVAQSIVVNMGYTADLFLSQLPGIKLTKLGAPAEAIMALQSGSVDAFVCAQSSLTKMLKTKSLQQLQQFVIPETGDAYALAMSKHKLEFKEEINVILKAMKKDGTLKKLEKKWDLS